MHEASPTEVPPNFMTWTLDFIVVRFAPCCVVTCIVRCGSEVASDECRVTFRNGTWVCTPGVFVKNVKREDLRGKEGGRRVVTGDSWRPEFWNGTGSG